ncbi:MAG: pentapeptide repeat-containing protein [Acidimicrobiia bacterium]
MLKRLGLPGLVVGLVVGLAAGGTFAWAAIPDSATGMIAACYPRSGPNKGVLRIIDHQAGRACTSSEAMVMWPSRAFRWRGQWQSSTAYAVNDVVGSNGSAYIATQATTNILPSNASYWSLMASVGSQGTPGASAGVCVGYPHAAIDWSGCDVAGAALAGQNFSGANLTGADISSANLTGANLVNANLSNANLSDANLSNANLEGATVTGTNFAGATMVVAPAGGIIGTPAALPVGWSVLFGYLIGPGALLESASLAGQSLAGLNLTGVNLISANLTGANLTGVNLTNASVDFADLSGANVTDANLTGADLANTTFQNATGLSTVTGVFVFDDTVCPDGTNSSTNGTSPQSCVGHE